MTFVVGPRTALWRVSAQWGLWGKATGVGPGCGCCVDWGACGRACCWYWCGELVFGPLINPPLLVVGRSAMGVLGDVGHIVTKPDCGVVRLFTFSTAFSDARSSAGRGAEGER